MYSITLLGKYAIAKTLQKSVIELLEIAGNLKGAKSMHECGRVIYMSRSKDDAFQRILPQYTCKMRLCPLCQLRRSRKIAANARAAMNKLVETKRTEGMRLILVTLTQKNCAPGKLAEELTKILEACERLRHKRAYRKNVVGAARSIEITYNSKADTWHPHVHMIVIVRGDEAALPLHTLQWWQTAWKELNDIDYAPRCDAQYLRNTDAVYEVSKYVSKLSDIIDAPEPNTAAARLMELSEAIAKRRLVAYSGIWAEARREIAANDEDISSEAEGQAPILSELEHTIMIWTGCSYKPVLQRAE